jgi:hypothetical protein
VGIIQVSEPSLKTRHKAPYAAFLEASQKTHPGNPDGLLRFILWFSECHARVSVSSTRLPAVQLGGPIRGKQTTSTEGEALGFIEEEIHPSSEEQRGSLRAERLAPPDRYREA